MQYNRQTFKNIVSEYGEVFFVLDSDREYEIHGERSYSFLTRGGETLVRVDGLRDDEYIITEFPLDAIEHHYSHKEV